MKRILALILAIVCVGAIACGCGKKDESHASGDSKSDTSTASVDGGESSQTSADTVKTFDDLPSSQRMGDLDIYINAPDLSVESYGYGFATKSSLNNAVVAASGNEAQPGVSIDDAFAQVYGNDYFLGILNMYRKSTYAEYTPNILEKVTLPCGEQAIKFEGKQPVDDYGTKGECYVKGYSFMFNDVPMIVAYVMFEGDLVLEATGGNNDPSQTELENYIDEMVQTVRTQP